jgi:glycosyltransferase involved in cell wall biosynthesis
VRVWPGREKSRPDHPGASALAATAGGVVIVCCYTRKRYNDLIAAIGSLQGQTRRPEEVIVVVDHNRALERDLVRLKLVVIPNRHRRGVSGARNSGLEAARGDVIAFLDDDAVAEPGWLARLCGWYSAPAVIGVGAGSCLHGIAAARHGSHRSSSGWWGARTWECPRAPVRNLIGCNMSFRREVFESAGAVRTSTVSCPTLLSRS